MGTVTKQQKKVPQLRFDGFSEKWVPVEVGSLFNVVVGFVGTVSTEYCDRDSGVPFVRTLNVKDGYFSQNELQYVTKDFHAKNKKSQVFNGDILIARVGANMGLVCEIQGLNSEANSANVVIIKRNDQLVSGFYSYYLSSEHGKRQVSALGAGGAQDVLNIGVVKTMFVPKIVREEQQKIADFLGSVDAWLDNLRQQKTALENYKRGMMQKLFTQQVRFKDDNGKDFSEWTEDLLGSHITQINKRNRAKKLDLVLSVSNKRGFVIQEEHFLDYRVASKDTSNYKIVTRGDFAFNPSRINVGSIALLKQYDEGIVSPMYTVFKTTDSLLSDFLQYFTKMHNFNQQVIMGCSGSVRDSLSFEALEQFNIPLPNNEEQQKIVDFLIAIDQSITAKAEEITKVEQWKRGLMQKMFV